MNGRWALWVGLGALAFLLWTPPANAVVYFDDGGMHVVNWGIAENVVVQDDMFFGRPTTVELVSGGSMEVLEVFDNSGVTISGGSIDSLEAYDNSRATVSSGLIEGHLLAYGHSSIRFSGGSTGQALAAHNTASVTFFGGNIGWGLSSEGASQVTISGGSIASIVVAYHTSEVTIWGGSIGGNIQAGGSGTHSSLVTFVGSDFAINGAPVGYGEYGTGGQDWIHGTLTGTQANGGSFDNSFFIYRGSHIALVPTPAARGDANCDGVVNVFDLGILANHYGPHSQFGDMDWVHGDFNADKTVDIFDLGILANNYQPGGVKPVPEPATLALLAIGGLALVRRRR